MKTSKTNVRRSSPAQSSRGMRSFFGSLLTPAWVATFAPSSPAWGACKVCTLGQISRTLYEVGGQYRRNM
ncbi:hypothetical protein [Cystobacter fuscus]|uniref:hypothetical protein n=1 Tax=Cystobacter fuscus TaxID=43 RepID=UPI0012FE2C9F|nr:hypothetical protein [Cystobacter fuscus]